MIAKDIMTTAVVSVRADMPIRDIARLLAGKGISAVPVVDDSGAPIGMVSEGDLIGRSAPDAEARRDWWLAMLAEGEALNPDYLATLHSSASTAAAVMSAPVITVSETTPVSEIARILEAYHIKRVPVLREGRVVGIVSRADLVRALAYSETGLEIDRHSNKQGLLGAISALDERFLHAQSSARTAAAFVSPATPANAAITAEHLRELATKYRHQESQRHDEARRALLNRLREQVRDFTEHHVGNDTWQAVLAHVVEAAEHGAKEFLLLRFPNALCSDGGRAINAPLPDWPKTLRGEPAELYLRWERDLKPRGFRLSARVLEFPDGFPGDIGLFLSWAS
jgi:CBS domain-containing protein